MCGITGLIGRRIESSSFDRMVDRLAHRGPDDRGTWYSEKYPTALGHRRLSILDLSQNGHQPMQAPQLGLVIVHNGEVYNFKEIRSKLEGLGHRFRSDSDTEVLLYAYHEWGEKMLDHLRGMFSFAIWDENSGELFAVRDRLGIKPFYYVSSGDYLAFASEIKSLLEMDQFAPTPDVSALYDFLTYMYIPAPKTNYREIKKLPAGHYLKCDSSGRMRIHKFWDVECGTDRPGSKEQTERLENLIGESVAYRMISDVPVGYFLSGGIDSSIIVALMARNSSRPVKTFSIGYKDLPSFDETSYAREVAQFNNTDHYEFKLSYQDILDAFPSVLENLDEPFADSSAVPTFIVSRETRNHVTVALSGDGGDELFAGYRMYLGEYWSRYYAKIPALLRNGLIAPLINTLPDARDKPGLEMVRRMKKFVKGMSPSFPERFCGWREIFSFPMRQRILKRLPEENLYLEHIRTMVKREEGRFHGDTINLMLFMDVKGLLPGDMLTKVDRMSMANALEVRVPFLDHTLAEYVFQLQGNTKLKGRVGKYILMETFKDLLPPSLHRRPKWGFEMPIGTWLKNELKFLVDEYLAEDLIRRQDIFHYEFIKELINRHMNGLHDTSWHLWNLIVFQHWYKTYL